MEEERVLSATLIDGALARISQQSVLDNNGAFLSSFCEDFCLLLFDLTVHIKDALLWLFGHAADGPKCWF